MLNYTINSCHSSYRTYSVKQRTDFRRSRQKSVLGLCGTEALLTDSNYRIYKNVGWERAIIVISTGVCYNLSYHWILSYGRNRGDFYMVNERTKVNYKPLWKLLIDRDMSKARLREEASIFQEAQRLRWQTTNLLLWMCW